MRLSGGSGVSYEDEERDVEDAIPYGLSGSRLGLAHRVKGRPEEQNEPIYCRGGRPRPPAPCHRAHAHRVHTAIASVSFRPDRRRDVEDAIPYGLSGSRPGLAHRVKGRPEE